MGGTLGSGPSRAQSPPPGQHAYNVLPYSPNTHYVYRASRCKCEIVNEDLEEEQSDDIESQVSMCENDGSSQGLAFNASQVDFSGCFNKDSL